jgi:hypothetical protein
MKPKITFKNADELIALMLESKRQSKIESAAFAKTKEFQEIKKRLQKKTNEANAISN